jgi:hypothetical protein
MDAAEIKPLLVNNQTARKLIGVGNTKYWELVKAGQIKLVDVGGRKLAVYASLEALAYKDTPTKTSPRKPDTRVESSKTSVETVQPMIHLTSPCVRAGGRPRVIDRAKTKTHGDR